MNQRFHEASLVRWWICRSFPCLPSHLGISCYLNVLPPKPRLSPASSVDAGEPWRPSSTSALVPVRPSSRSICLSTSSAAGGPIVRDLLASDDAESADLSVGAGIGRSGERNSTGPPI